LRTTPSTAYGMVVPRLVRQALCGEPLTVFGDGTQRRCFCHVADVVEALVGLLDSLLAGGGAVGEAFNVGSAEEVSILELARRVLERTRSCSPIHLVPYEQAYGRGFEDMVRRVPDTSKLARLTGWAPRRTLDEILDDVAEEARRELAASAGKAPGGGRLRPALPEVEPEAQA
jgi:nucleoside-diphosphate-sugar epimerase